MTKTQTPDEVIKPNKEDAKMLKERAKHNLAIYERKSAIKAGIRGLTLTDLAAGYEIAKAFAGSGVLPKVYYEKMDGLSDEQKINKAAQRALVAMQLGAEIGLPPMQSIKAVTFINDMPVVWGDSQLAIVRASGLLAERQESYDDTQKIAYCRMVRTGGEEVEHTFSREDAQRAKLLTKDNWSKYEKRMLQLRARSFCIRDLFTDVLGGLTHTAEEMGGGDYNEPNYKPELISESHQSDNDVFAQKVIPKQEIEEIATEVEISGLGEVELVEKNNEQ